MFGLPQSTEVKKQLPKKVLYAKFDLKPAQRESFDADVARIDIVAVVSPATVPALAVGEEVKEFYLLAVQLKRKEYDTKNIMLLTKLIPQRMVLALHYEEQVQFAVHHTRLITSNWMPHAVGTQCIASGVDNANGGQRTQHVASLRLEGINLDIVWENIVKDIGRIDVAEGNTLTEQIATNDQRTKLLAQIATLERKMANEKQPRRKREYFEQIKKLKNQL